MASSSVRNHPNFAVICSFLQRYGEHLRLPDLTIPELEEVLEETNAVGHGLKELIITLMKRVVNSIKPDRWEKHLIKLIDNYHSPVAAWELESLGFSLCKLETKLSILKYLCETQFDDNPKFKNIVNKETPEEQKVKPIGRDKLGLVYWFQKDQECNIRIYREEQDDVEETSWQTVGRGRDDLANLIAELKVAYGAKLPLDSLESSRSATPILVNGDANIVKPETNIGTNSTKEGTVVASDGDESGAKGDVKSEDCLKNGEVKGEGQIEKEIKKEKCEKSGECEGKEEKLNLSEGVVVKSEIKKEDEDKETVTSQEDCKKEDALKAQEEQKTGAEVVSSTEDSASKTAGGEERAVGIVVKEEKGAVEGLASTDCGSEEKKLENVEKESSLVDSKCCDKEKGEGLNEKSQKEEAVPAEKAGEMVDGKLPSDQSVPTGDSEGEQKDKGCLEEQPSPKEKESERSSKPFAEETAKTVDAQDEVKGANKKKDIEEDAVEVKKDTEKKENGDTSVTLQTQDESKQGSKGQKSETLKAETPALEESPEMGWSRRRLRVRKPPPKKEEEVVVQEKPKKKVKDSSKTAKNGDEGVKKRERKKKKIENEEETEEEEEEEEESEESEEDNTSDEDFILAKEKGKDSSGDTAPPVVKARTAKSKTKSKGSSKKVEPEELSDEPCIKCGNYNHPDQILLCDSCDAGYHTACLRPPLMYVPDGQWFCPACEHLALLKNLEATLEVVDGELKVIRQKNRKKQDKYKWLLTEVCSANILPEDSSVLITKRIERVEKPEKPRHERTRPQPRKASRAFIEEPEEIEYIQRRSGRNRKQISYKFEEFDSAINTAIHEEVEEKRKAKEQEEQTGFGRSRGKDMSTIEAARWEEEEEEEEHASRKKKKKKLNDLDATSEEEGSESDEFEINNENCSDEDFVVEGDEEESCVTEEDEEEAMSSMSDSGSEYGSRRKKGSQKKKKVPVRRRRDLGPVRRSSRNLGRERKVYQDSSSSESEEERPRDAWRVNPIITARRQRGSESEFSEENNERRKKRRRQASSQDSGDGSEYESRNRSNLPKEGSKKRKKKSRKDSSSSEEDEDEGYVQPKRKFRIDSDEDSNGSGADKDDNSQDKELRDESEDEIDRTKRKLTVRKTLRGMCSKRVDYRKMANGSSSEEEDKIEEVEEDELNRKNDLEHEEMKHEVKDSVTDDSRITGNVKEGERVVGTSMVTGNVNQNNSTAADDDSLSPISDLEDLKENGSFSSEKVQTISSDKIDKRSTEDDDDLEGVTDIFDYLSKD